MSQSWNREEQSSIRASHLQPQACAKRSWCWGPGSWHPVGAMAHFTDRSLRPRGAGTCQGLSQLHKGQAALNLQNSEPPSGQCRFLRDPFPANFRLT